MAKLSVLFHTSMLDQAPRFVIKDETPDYESGE